MYARKPVIIAAVCVCVCVLCSMGQEKIAVRGTNEFSSLSLTQRFEWFNAHYDSLLERMSTQRFCSDILLSRDERVVDGYLVNLGNDLQAEYKKTGNYPFARPFPQAKAEIERTELFAELKRMPKGGALHLHGSTAGRIDWVVENALPRTNSLMYWPPAGNDGGRGRLAFKPQADTNYIPTAKLREQLKKEGRCLEDEYRALLIMNDAALSTESGWQSFNASFGRIGDIATYYPVALEYLQDAFEFLCEEKIYYVELRISEGMFFDETTEYKDAAFIEVFRTIEARVKKKHPRFKLKLILCAVRFYTAEELAKKALLAHQARETFGHFVVGVDFIGPEDMGRPTLEYAKLLLEHSFDPAQLHFNLYLHDGESAWADNNNLLAALLLSAKRLGHGFNLFRFPILMQSLAESSIALEVCPISNQSLGLLNDLRLHPAAGYMNQGIQCVLGADDPLLFGNDGLTYDFWQAFVAWDLDLAALKKLARNSLTLSGMPDGEKQEMLKYWEADWDEWIASVKLKATNQ